jgi:L-alanine-DL-glutamate epimerase-like enolase superfamily enzyme
MKISDIRLGQLSIPLRTPFKTALRTITRVEDVLLTISTDQGAVGYGSAAPVTPITGDTADGIRAAIAGPVKKYLVGRAVENFEDIIAQLHALPGVCAGARAAADIALYDLCGRLRASPVYKLLGGGRKELTTDLTISLNEPEIMARDSLDAVRRGFATLKLKVGGHPAKDMERLMAVRMAVGKDINLRLDANQGWTPEDAVSLIEKMEAEGLGIELVEQPVKGPDLEGLKYVTDRVGIPVVADESAFSPRDVADIIRMRAADMINIKLMKTGGIYPALRICDLAHAAGMECMIGCMLESRISVTAAAHLACAGSVITKIDLDPPLLCSGDPVEGGARYDNALITLPDAPGLGFRGVQENSCAISKTLTLDFTNPDFELLKP